MVIGKRVFEAAETQKGRPMVPERSEGVVDVRRLERHSVRMGSLIVREGGLIVMEGGIGLLVKVGWW